FRSLEAGRVLRELVLDRGGALVEHLERAPVGAVGRHRVGREELCVHVAGEVDAGVDRVVEVGRLEAVDRRQAGLVENEGRLRGGGIGGGGLVPAAGGHREGDGGGQEQQAGCGCTHGILRGAAEAAATAVAVAGCVPHCTPASCPGRVSEVIGARGGPAAGTRARRQNRD